MSPTSAAERFGVDWPLNGVAAPAEEWETGGALSIGYTKTSGTRTGVEFRKIPQNAFSVGEKITLSVRYMGIPCGELTMSVGELTTYRGRPVYVVHAHARTNRAFSLFYEISDTLTSYVDAEGLFSWKYIKDIHETKDDTRVVHEYDHALGTWTSEGARRGEILPYTQDLLSAIYYLRGVAWNEGDDTIEAPLNDTKKNYQMRFGLGKRRKMSVLSEQIPVRAGRPTVELEGKYKMIGTNEVWFTDDPRRIPVLVKSNIRLGNLYAKLVEYVPGALAARPIAANGRDTP